MRGDARGRTDEKFAPFALSRNSSSATHPRVCDACLQCTGLDNILNCYPYLKRPILHIKTAPRAIRQRLSNKSIFTTLPMGQTKGLNPRHHQPCGQHPGGKGGGHFINIHYFQAFLCFGDNPPQTLKRSSDTNYHDGYK